MNKKELAQKLVERELVKTKVDAEAVVNAVFEEVAVALKNGERVELHSFGIFETVERAERIGRNIATGESIQIPASKVVKFKVSKVLKESVAK